MIGTARHLLKNQIVRRYELAWEMKQMERSKYRQEQSPQEDTRNILLVVICMAFFVYIVFLVFTSVGSNQIGDEKTAQTQTSYSEEMSTAHR
jgi:hypothetical protein